MNRLSRSLTAGCLAALLAWPATADEAIDPRIAQNPALMDLYERDPDAATALLADIDTLLEQPRGQRPRNLDEDEQVIELLIENPILQEVFRRDPKATAKLIDVIRPTTNK